MRFPLPLPLLLAACSSGCILLLGPVLQDKGDGGGTVSHSRVPVRPFTSPAFTAFEAGGAHDCALTSGGLAYCWGRNDFGELGTGSTQPRSTPARVAGMHTFAAISAGDNFPASCGVASDSTGYCWGFNQVGQLGIDTADFLRHDAPEAVHGGLRFGSISTGGGFACGVSRGGVAYCWGEGGNGELGDSLGQSSAIPVAVAGGLTFARISAGPFHACGVTTQSAAYCWGLGWNGELGIGTPPEYCFGSNACSRVPRLVTGGLQWSVVVAGQGTSCGVTTAGAAYCWGAGFFGEIGAGRDTSTNTPFPVASGLTWRDVGAGRQFGCGLTTDSTAYCWGLNDIGQLGNGSDESSHSNTPVAVSGGLTFAALRVGRDHACGLTAGGAVWCWGYRVGG